MDLRELLHVLWRRRLLLAATVLVVVGATVGTLKLVTPEYQATSTLALTPKDLNDPNSAYVFFGTLNAIVPVYADAATLRSTKEAARALLGRSLAPISVETFKGTGIIKIKARSTDPSLAQRSAQAVTNALVARTQSGEVGVKTLELKVLDRPSLPRTPVFPRTRLSVFAACIIGLLLGIGVVLLRENLGTTIETAEDLAQVAGVPSYGEVPHERAVARLAMPEALAVDTRLRIFAEALRDIRTNLLFSEGGSVRSVLITSPEGSHGKTTIACGLAMTLAQAGTRTLLLDADLRRGRISDMLAIERSPGLGEVLVGEAPLEEAIRKTTNASLDVLTGGRRLPDPAEMLTISFGPVLSQLEQMYESVVIDGTPIVPISDARMVARFAESTVVVVSAGKATRRQLRAAFDRLSVISVRPTAVILNDATMGAPSYYDYVIPEGAPRQGRRRGPSERLASRR
jgi:capsular exopolysaccharide synthesis family protein